jgi:hypothetical protein
MGDVGAASLRRRSGEASRRDDCHSVDFSASSEIGVGQPSDPQFRRLQQPLEYFRDRLRFQKSSDVGKELIPRPRRLFEDIDGRSGSRIGVRRRSAMAARGLREFNS